MERLHGEVPATLKRKVRLYCVEHGISVGRLLVEALELKGLKP